MSPDVHGFKAILFNPNNAIALTTDIEHKCSEESGEIGKDQTKLMHMAEEAVNQEQGINGMVPS